MRDTRTPAQCNVILDKLNELIAAAVREGKPLAFLSPESPEWAVGMRELMNEALEEPRVDVDAAEVIKAMRNGLPVRYSDLGPMTTDIDGEPHNKDCDCDECRCCEWNANDERYPAR